ncbi:MAG: Hsp33 family molecular chaperone HslO [Lachnospirales bacterium]
MNNIDTDNILRVTAGNGSIRGFFCKNTTMAQNSFIYHNTVPAASIAMGRSLAAASMMGIMLKNEKDLVTMRIQGDGPMKGLLVTGESNGNAKGYPYNNDFKYHLLGNNIDVGGAMGYGTMTITKDMGLKKPYAGQIPLITGEIADDLTYYFAKSEQTPTTVALSVSINNDYSIKSSGGFILQLLPSAKDDIITKLENKINSLEKLSTILDKGTTTEELAKIILGDFNLTILEKREIHYTCNCSYERTSKALISLGKDELEDILNTDGFANLKCHFCDKSYDFSKDDIRKIIENL